MNINIEKIKEILSKGKLKLYGSQTGYASIDRPWDKSNTEINVPNINCLEYLKQRSIINSSNVLARCHEDILTSDRFNKEVDEYAKSLVTMGVKKSDIVPICIQNTIEGIIAFYALNKIGAVTTFLNATANTNEIENYIKRYNAKNIFISSQYSDSIETIVNDCNLNHAVVISTKDSMLRGTKISSLTKEFIASSTKEYKENEKILSLKSFKKMGFEKNIKIEYKPSKDDGALICYTSGSTGNPKAIYLTNENIIAELISLKKTTHMQLGPKGNSMQVVPFYYPYGFIISTLFPMYVGKTTALTPILTTQNLCSYLKMYKPSYISGIPPLYKSLLTNPEAKDLDLSYVKYIISGGDLFDITSKKNVNNFFAEHGSTAKVLDGSGNGEGGGSLTNPLALFAKYNPYSVGRPLKGLDVKIVDPETGDEVQYGQVGRFCFSGKNVMQKYYGKDKETSEVKYLDKDGKVWFHTDTLMHMDNKGWMYMDGRERRFFITYDKNGSPYKVYCNFVQSIINELPFVDDCIVVQKPDAERYFVPKAYVVLNNNIELTQDIIDKIVNYCKSKLQSCAIPIDFEQINEIKYTKAEKIDYKYYENSVLDSNQSSKILNKKMV